MQQAAAETNPSWDQIQPPPLPESGPRADKPPRIIFFKSGRGERIRSPDHIGSRQATQDAQDAHDAAAADVQWQVSRNSSCIDWRFYLSGPRASEAAAVRPRILFAGQIKHLVKNHSPANHRGMVRRFIQWTEAIASTWSMLQSGQLPCELSQDSEISSLLWRILEQEQRHARSNNEDEEEGHRGRIDRIATLWGTLPPDERAEKWPLLLIVTFRSCPLDLAVDLFAATVATSAAAAPPYVVDDAVSYLIRSNAASVTTVANKVDFGRLVGLLQLAMAAARGTTSDAGALPLLLRLRQNTIHALLKAARTPDDVAGLYGLLQSHGQPLHLNTLIQFAHRLAKDPAHKAQAVDMVRLMVAEHGLDVNSVKGSALCTVILSSGWGRVAGNNSITRESEIAVAAQGDDNGDGDGKKEGQQQLPTPARLFEQLLATGLEPNIITYTAIIRELCSKGEIASAQEVLQIMLGAQTGLDAYVYSILINGAKTAGHYALVRQVAEASAANGVWHPFVWNDFLQAIHVMALAEARSDPEHKRRPRMVPAFPLMLETYRKLFAPEPLLDVLPFVGRLNHSPASHDDNNNNNNNNTASSDVMRRRWEFVRELGPTLSQLPVLGPDDVLAPTGVTLTTMVLGYIQGLSNPDDVIGFYSHFHRLLKTGHPTAVMIVEQTGSMVYDTVIMALCEYDGMLRVALDVVSDMLRDAAVGLDPEPESEGPHVSEGLDGSEGVNGPDSTESPPGLHSPPSVYTWSILLNGFMFHRHTMQGERILRMMAKRGIRPNEVTWNTLIAGYARLQFARKTGNALLRRELAGYEPNEFTFRAFSYLGDKAAVIKYLERHRAMKTATAAAEAEARQQQHQHHPEIARQLRSLKHDLDGIVRTMDE